MPVGLRECFFSVLAFSEGTSLQQNIIRSADALLAGGDENDLIGPLNDAANVTAADLLSPLLERFEMAIEHLAALWLAAKFWGTSTHRVSMLSLVTDILETGISREADDYGVPLQYATEIVNRLYKAEMVLLRRSRYVVPCVYGCESRF
ncbi:hypothetical protein C3747_172g309c [Trypanosoma cruzi]|uniref:Uncharacterized protein n=2 Tax=Trypanosoma cruzi TaxID=5693 RepID=Q4E3Q4_TRYCC|nr:hypothetical protein, conserved [Trypanosoma cruzi]EAN99408.1 hypothetical protein, conserved [Trypanosoma cruzi]PWV03652.1 hypothetical protein C3747_172g309c [Trypanosoma cruzi]RNC60569.1 hypothetical protein TcCL_ESM01736 [Trypanosoma cruzi]|eukprot:XP_821259.1 hypothetical protein [Trypanosoma cruzi strain CL Brener]